MPNPWIEHIKKFAKEHNITYAAALSDPKCKESYKSGAKSGAMTARYNGPMMNK